MDFECTSRVITRAGEDAQGETGARAGPRRQEGAAQAHACGVDAGLARLKQPLLVRGTRALG